MKYKFNKNKKWFRNGIISLVNALGMLFVGLVLFNINVSGNLANLSLVIILITDLFMIYKAIYYFQLHEKDYLIIEKNSLSIHKGIFPRKIIRLNQIERVDQVSDVIILDLKDGKEEEIYTEWLSDNNTTKFKEALRQVLGSKANAI